MQLMNLLQDLRALTADRRARAAVVLVAGLAVAVGISMAPPDLEHDPAIVLGVPSLIHLAHAAFADLGGDVIRPRHDPDSSGIS